MAAATFFSTLNSGSPLTFLVSGPPFCKAIADITTILIDKSKRTKPILLCPWERHFTALSSAWWS